jgi:hypothetical protein
MATLFETNCGFWQYLFPASRRTIIAETDGGSSERRFHVDESLLQRAVKQAVREAGVRKAAKGCNIRRHAAAP